MNNNNNMWQKYQNIPPQQSGQQGAVPQPQQPTEQNGQQGAVPQPQQLVEPNSQQGEQPNSVVSDADVSSQYGAYKPKYNYAALTKPDKNATGVIIGIIVFLVVLLLVGIVGFAITSGDDIEKGTQEFFDNLNSSDFNACITNQFNSQGNIFITFFCT